MTPPTCSTCVHFELTPSPFDATEFGRCKLIPATGQQSDDFRELEDAGTPFTDDDRNDDGWMKLCHPGITAFTADASMYSSTLWVRPEFGCVLHEAASA